MNTNTKAEASNFSSKASQILSKVPEVTLYFWVIKVLCTTVGETASDFFNVTLNFGLRGTSIMTGILLAILLFIQFKTKKYSPIIYWLTVVLISVFGTLVTDNLTDGLRVPLIFSTILFSILLAITFIAWYAKEKTLSIHSIFTKRREVFYWLTILFTFALGTAAGDLMAERLALGYGLTGLIILGVIAIFAIAWRRGLNAIIAFWFIYIMTRPLGASLGDYLSQSKTHGGLGLGSTITSVLFLVAIALTVAYLAISKKDALPSVSENSTDKQRFSVALQLVIVLTLLIAVSGTGFYLRQRNLQAADSSAIFGQEQGSGPNNSTATGSQSSLSGPLGDLTTFKTITQDMLSMVNANNLSGAKTRADDLEYEWDHAQSRLKPMNTAKWNEIDGAIDKVLRSARAVSPSQQDSKAALEALLKHLNT